MWKKRDWGEAVLREQLRRLLLVVSETAVPGIHGSTYHCYVN